MKSDLNLSIPNPCTEKWNNFAPTPEGGFCSNCSKNVIDFTGMCDAEVVAFFRSNHSHTCGRFRQDQLKAYSLVVNKQRLSNQYIFKAGILASLLILSEHKMQAQDTTLEPKAGTTRDVTLTDSRTQTVEKQFIEGVVKSNYDNHTMSGVSVTIKGVSFGTTSDGDGKFRSPRQVKAGEVLVFSFIGHHSFEYIVPQALMSGIEILMLEDSDVRGEVIIIGQYYDNKKPRRGLWSKIKSIF